MKENTMRLCFDARSQNEAFARVAVGAFFAQLNPTLEQLADVKTAVSEAVTNAIVHGYGGWEQAQVTIACRIEGERIEIAVMDQGVGIADVQQARKPFFTTGAPEQRSGMGFAVMEAFMDSLAVESRPGAGTTVTMTKIIPPQEGAEQSIEPS